MVIDDRTEDGLDSKEAKKHKKRNDDVDTAVEPAIIVESIDVKMGMSPYI
jgi:hypothetical protein